MSGILQLAVVYGESVAKQLVVRLQLLHRQLRLELFLAVRLQQRLEVVDGRTLASDLLLQQHDLRLVFVQRTLVLNKKQRYCLNGLK